MQVKLNIQTLFILLLLCTVQLSYSQSQVKVSGKVVDANSEFAGPQIVPGHIVIVNHRTGTGVFTDADGSFSLLALQQDTLRFSANGYTIKDICFKDSVIKKEYVITVQLLKLKFVLKEVEVFPVKKLEEVQKEIDKIGTRKTNAYEGFNSFESPITALFERFNKIEQSKRWVAEKENEELKRSILKDLFRIYIQYDIISLADDEFDEFISFCYFGLSENFIKTATEFELVMAIKERYAKFVSIKNSARSHF